MDTSHTGPIEVSDEVRQPLQGWALAAVVAALFLTLLMAALDGTIVDTAIPRIIGDLHGFSLYSWLVTSYLLASTTIIPIAGKLSDLFGRKWFVVGGVGIFLVGSILAGVSQSMIQLIIFRGVQGLGSGILQTLALILIAELFPPKQRARWLGFFSAVIILASIIGPLAGGWITDHLGWRWIFYINIPLGLFSLVIFLIYLPVSFAPDAAPRRVWETLRRVDIIGAITIVAGSICLLLGLTLGGGSYAWTSPLVIGLFVAATLLFLLFFYVESRVQDPILPLDLFKNQVFSAGALLSFLLGMVLFAVVIYLPLFMQAVQGQSPTSSGTVMTPLTVTIAILSIVTGIAISRFGRYQIVAIVGAIVLAIGMFFMTQLTVATSSLEIMRNVFCIGVGLGILMPLVNVATQNVLPQQRLGIGTSAITFLRSMGSTLATAVLGTIVSVVSSQQISANLPSAARRFSDTFVKAATEKQVLTNPDYRQSIIDQGVATAVKASSSSGDAGTLQQITQQTTVLLNNVFEVVRQSLATGIHQAFIVAFCLSVAIVVIALFLKDRQVVEAKSGE